MERAALLAQPPATSPLPLFDTGGDPARAAAQARRAVKGGARLLLGPLTAAEARAVAAAVGVPVLAFTNDAAATAANLFALGVTPAQSAGAVLRYARSRGVRRVGVAAGATPWGEAVRAAARAAPGLSVVDAADGPDAVLIASDTDLARWPASGAQLLGLTGEGALAAIEGAWLAAPDPATLGPFARAYEARFASRPGLLAAIAYDAARIAAALEAANRVERAGLIDPAGFTGAAGAVRLGATGACTRELAILVVDGGAPRAIARLWA